MTVASIPFLTPSSPLSNTQELPSKPLTPESKPPHRLVLATDHHPLVLTNLQSNVNLNFPPSRLAEDPSRRIEVHPLDWLQFHDDGPDVTVGRDGVRDKAQVVKIELEPPFDQGFDVIFGADVVYE